MDDVYAQATDDSDPVYFYLSRAFEDDYYSHLTLLYSDYLHEQLDLLMAGRMLIKDYNNFLKKGVPEVLTERYQKYKNITLLKKIQKENPELIEELLKDIKQH